MNHLILTPPFTSLSAYKKIKAYEHHWNVQDIGSVIRCYCSDILLQNGFRVISGKEALAAFLRKKWREELNIRMHVELWTYKINKVAVITTYQWNNNDGKLFIAKGNEFWEFDEEGLIREQVISVNTMNNYHSRIF